MAVGIRKARAGTRSLAPTPDAGTLALPLAFGGGVLTCFMDVYSPMINGGGHADHSMSLVAACLKVKGCVALPVKNQMAKDLMTSPALVIKPETTVQEISELLSVTKVNRVPVVNEAGKLVGIVSRGDLVPTICQGARRC